MSNKSQKLSIRFAAYDEVPTKFHQRKSGEKHYREYECMEYLRKTYRPNELPPFAQFPIYLNYKVSTGELNIRQIPIYLDTESANDLEINLCQFIIRTELPTLNYEQCTKELVKSLKNEKKKIQAETQQKLNAIDDQISKLLAITHQPTLEAQ